MFLGFFCRKLVGFLTAKVEGIVVTDQRTQKCISRPAWQIVMGIKLYKHSVTGSFMKLYINL